MDVMVEATIKHYVIVKNVNSVSEAEEIAECYPTDNWELSDESQIVTITSSDIVE